jgi:ferredoxin
MSFDLTIEPLGQTVAVEDGQTLLDASLRSGVYLPHACGHGLCGTCKVRVLDGEACAWPAVRTPRATSSSRPTSTRSPTR